MAEPSTLDVLLRRARESIRDATGIDADTLGVPCRPALTFNTTGLIIESAVANSNPDPRAAALARAFGQTHEPRGIATMTDVERRGF